jgi:RimJ/RimL family protein N-acetyltransferase
MMSTAADWTCAYSPRRYPAHLVAAWRLHDGANIVIRPIRPEDDAIESAFISALSRDTGYNRLLSGRKLTPEEIRHLTRIDYEQEMAFIAVIADGGQSRLLGVARYVRDAGATGAEFAVVVADAWQRKGIATLLLGTLLRHAHSAGIGRLHGITLALNQPMQNLARKFGFAQTHDPQDATVRRLEKTLAAGVSLAAAGASAVYRGAAAIDEAIV